MVIPPATSKGAATREAILDRAYMIAASAGLEGLSIGPLADAVNMSKSGVFAHFGSREELQLAVLDLAADRFGEHTLIPALAQPRGLPRLRALLANWFDWLRRDRGGCLVLTAASEYDDRPGPLRDRMIHHHLRLRQMVARAVAMAIDSGELRADLDPEQAAFELNTIALAVQHDMAISDPDSAMARGERMLEHLLDYYAPRAS
ncbi:MAG: TetR/AcrR family transcriptional regulator [Xanthomonadales bacterium]|nr:TetR/AcrR family transcriptional regulator [Xanthomonadales bacterium]